MADMHVCKWSSTRFSDALSIRNTGFTCIISVYCMYSSPSKLSFLIAPRTAYRLPLPHSAIVSSVCSIGTVTLMYREASRSVTEMVMTVLSPLRVSLFCMSNTSHRITALRMIPVIARSGMATSHENASPNTTFGSRTSKVYFPARKMPSSTVFTVSEPTKRDATRGRDGFSFSSVDTVFSPISCCFAASSSSRLASSTISADCERRLSSCPCI